MDGSNKIVQQDSLLATKLYIPPARLHLVSRPRLIERLNRGWRCQLTLISAPAGFGKTTLLSEWCAALPEGTLPVAWVSLDQRDNDPARFWAYVIAALEKIFPGTGDPVLAMLRSAQPVPIEAMLTTLINAFTAIPRDFALVLDDYHVIDAQPVADALLYLLDNLPPQMHLFIASRVDPSWPLARLRARDQLNELRTADLRFTPGEAASFLSQVPGLHLSPGDIAVLESRTEGWIAGLQLAALSMRGHEDTAEFISTFSGGHRFIAEFLFTEVLHQQPGEVQSFLLHTSILDRLAGSLCNAVSERDDGQHMLETLEHSNLFLVPLDDEGRWYRYHQLFSDFLRSRLQLTQPGLLPALHRRASAWFEYNGLVVEAINHAFAAGDFEHAAELIEPIVDDLTKRGEQKTLLTWLEALPGAQMRLHPRLILVQAWGLLMTGQADAAEKRLRAAEELLEDSSEAATLLATIASMRGNIEQIAKHAAHALEQMPGNNTGLRGLLALNEGTVHALSGDTEAAARAFAEARSLTLADDNIYAALIATCQSATIEMVQGRLHQAASTYQQALNLAARRPGELDTGLAHLGIGGILREWNKLEDATGHILEGIAQSQKSGNVGTLLFGYTELAQVKHAQGNEDASLECIEQVEQIVKSHAFPQFLLASIVEAVTRIYIARGDIASAMRWAEASVIEIQNEPENWHIQHMFEYLTSARIRLARGAFDEALALLDRLRQFAETEAYSSILISTLLLQALALEARGRTTQAMTALAQALTLAEPNGYVRIFVDEGPPMADLLMKILKVQQKKRLEAYNFSTDYAGSLLAAYRSDVAEDSPDSSRRPAQPLLNPLSERELEVLRLIANGLSNQEVMQKLIVEKNTLKTHIRHLYRKLNTRSRTQAIIRARELNLL